MPGLIYLRMNCLSECRRQWLLRLCNCSIDFMYPTFRDSSDCKISDFDCILKVSRIFNFNERTLNGNHNFRDARTEDLDCVCLPSCKRIDYDIEFSSLRMM